MTHFKISLIFLYSFAVMSTVAPGHVNAASFQLTWVDNSQNEDGFNIERKLNTNGTFSLIATVGPDVTSYVDDNLANTTTYCYRVNAFNDAGNSAYTNEACGTTPATSPPPSGNTISTNIANGTILSGSSVVWTATPSGSPVRVEFFIDGAFLWTENVSPYQFNGDPSGTLNTNTLSNGSHQLKVRAIYSDNSTAEQTVTVTAANAATPTPSPTPVSPPTPAPPSSTVTATLLGQTGEDITGPYSETLNGIQDVHIRLSGVQSTITRVKITDTGDGIWETPYNNQGNWVVAIRPQTDPSVVDLYFDFWQPSSSYTLNLTFANGSTLTIQTSIVLSTAALSTDATATLTATPLAGSSTATFQTTANQLITKIGVFRPDTGEWFLDRTGNGQWDGCALDTCISLFGQSGELPVTREISGFNGTIIGTFQPQQGLWKFDLNGNNTFDSCSVDECDENFGTLDDLPLVGDWIGSGTKHIGIFRPSTGEWFLDINGNGQWDGCGVDKCIEQFGGNGDLPVAGDWNGTGEVRIGVFRPSTGEWFLDMNGNGKFDGCVVDACPGPFGQPGDLPVVGKW